MMTTKQKQAQQRDKERIRKLAFQLKSARRGLHHYASHRSWDKTGREYVASSAPGYLCAENALKQLAR